MLASVCGQQWTKIASVSAATCEEIDDASRPVPALAFVTGLEVVDARHASVVSVNAGDDRSDAPNAVHEVGIVDLV